MHNMTIRLPKPETQTYFNIEDEPNYFQGNHWDLENKFAGLDVGVYVLRPNYDSPNQCIISVKTQSRYVNQVEEQIINHYLLNEVATSNEEIFQAFLARLSQHLNLTFIPYQKGPGLRHGLRV